MNVHRYVQKNPKKGQYNFSINLHLGALSLQLSGTAGYLLIRSLQVKMLICRGTKILTFGNLLFLPPLNRRLRSRNLIREIPRVPMYSTWMLMAPTVGRCCDKLLAAGKFGSSCGTVCFHGTKLLT